MTFFEDQDSVSNVLQTSGAAVKEGDYYRAELCHFDEEGKSCPEGIKMVAPPPKFVQYAGIMSISMYQGTCRLQLYGILLVRSLMKPEVIICVLPAKYVYFLAFVLASARKCDFNVLIHNCGSLQGV